MYLGWSWPSERSSKQDKQMVEDKMQIHRRKFCIIREISGVGEEKSRCSQSVIFTIFLESLKGNNNIVEQKYHFNGILID